MMISNPYREPRGVRAIPIAEMRAHGLPARSADETRSLARLIRRRPLPRRARRTR